MKKRFLSLMLALCMMPTFILMTPLNVSADEGMVINVSYVDENGVNKTCPNATKVTAGNSLTWGTAGTTTWYYLNENVNIGVAYPGNKLTINGDVRLILGDAKTLSVVNNVSHNDASNGIGISSDSSLTIYGQSDQTGKLVTNSESTMGYDGINNNGTLTINGGIIDAKSVGGGGSGINNGNVIINAGSLSAWGEHCGIKGNLTVNGGTVNAWGGLYGIDGSLTITKGNMIAECELGKASHINNNTPNLPARYQWRTTKTGTYTTHNTCMAIAYTPGNEKYMEINSLGDNSVPFHSGGSEATCKDKAKCSLCGEEYGEKDPSKHTSLRHIEAKAATVNEAGNIEYWHCEGCEKYFSDKDGRNKINQTDTIIKLDKTDNPRTDDNKMPFLYLSLSLGSMMGICYIKRKYSEK